MVYLFCGGKHRPVRNQSLGEYLYAFNPKELTRMPCYTEIGGADWPVLPAGGMPFGVNFLSLILRHRPNTCVGCTQAHALRAH